MLLQEVWLLEILTLAAAACATHRPPLSPRPTILLVLLLLILLLHMQVVGRQAFVRVLMRSIPRRHAATARRRMRGRVSSRRCVRRREVRLRPCSVQRAVRGCMGTTPTSCMGTTTTSCSSGCCGVASTGERVVTVAKLTLARVRYYRVAAICGGAARGVGCVR